VNDDWWVNVVTFFLVVLMFVVVGAMLGQMRKQLDRIENEIHFLQRSR